jgi:hypothetical protein
MQDSELLGEAFPFIADHRKERLNLLLRFPAPCAGGAFAPKIPFHGIEKRPQKPEAKFVFHSSASMRFVQAHTIRAPLKSRTFPKLRPSRELIVQRVAACFGRSAH